MNEQLAIPGMPAAEAVLPAPAQAERKAIDLAVLKRGAKDYLSFVDDTKETFYAYLYHRTGSLSAAQTLMSELYLDVLSRALSFLWFGTLSLQLLIAAADKALGKAMSGGEADLDNVYVPSLTWLGGDERKTVSSLHESLWTLPTADQRVLVLSLLMGFSDERIAKTMGAKVGAVVDHRNRATEKLLSAWQPSEAMRAKLTSLSFLPGIDISSETNLRFAVVEKYNALRMRRYQWAALGVFLAIFANVVVAGVIAFVVVVQSPTSLRGVKTEVAALDALLLRKEIAGLEAKRSLSALLPQARELAAYSAAREFTELGLSAAINALQQHDQNEADVDDLIKLLERASTAMIPAGRQLAMVLGQPVMLIDVVQAMVR